MRLAPVWNDFERNACGGDREASASSAHPRAHVVQHEALVRELVAVDRSPAPTVVLREVTALAHCEPQTRPLRDLQLEVS
jgi:hypothetical protein